VIGKFGVGPESIPDYLALVGDSADGYPGIKGWGAASTSAVLSRFKHIESIPSDPKQLGLGLGRATTLLENLKNNYNDALLFRELSTLRKDVERYLRQISDDGAARELSNLERDQLRRKLTTAEGELLAACGCTASVIGALAKLGLLRRFQQARQVVLRRWELAPPPLTW